MDCAALQSQLSELRSLHQTFQSDFNHMNETGTGNIALQSSQRVASAKTDELLGQYLDDFVEQNPEFFTWQDNAELTPDMQDIRAVSPTAEGDGILLLGVSYDGCPTVKKVKPDPDNHELIISSDLVPYPELEDSGLLDEILPPSRVIQPNANTIIIQPQNSTNLVIFQKNPSNEAWSYSHKIDLADNAYTYDGQQPEAAIYAYHTTPNGELFIGGKDLPLFVLKSDQDGHFDISQPVDLGDKYAAGTTGIESFCQLPDGSVLVASLHAVYRCAKDESGHWHLDDNAPNLSELYHLYRESTHTEHVGVESLAVLPSTDTLIIGLASTFGNEQVLCQRSYGRSSSEDDPSSGKYIPLPNVPNLSKVTSILPLSSKSFLACIEYRDDEFPPRIFELQQISPSEWQTVQNFIPSGTLFSVDRQILGYSDRHQPILLPNGSLFFVSQHSIVEYRRGSKNIAALKSYLPELITKGDNT